MAQRSLDLSTQARAALMTLRDTAPKAYLRERAAALVKIADGIPAAVVARTGLLRPRKPDTLYRWLDRYEQEGIDGLVIRAGRGRKSAFFRHPAGSGSCPAGPAPAPRPRSTAAGR